VKVNFNLGQEWKQPRVQLITTQYPQPKCLIQELNLRSLGLHAVILPLSYWDGLISVLELNWYPVVSGLFSFLSQIKINLHNHCNAEIWLSPSLYSIWRLSHHVSWFERTWLQCCSLHKEENYENKLELILENFPLKDPP